MPARSNARQKAAGAALQAKREGTDSDDLKGTPRSTKESMSEQELEGLDATQHKGLPAKKRGR